LNALLLAAIVALAYAGQRTLSRGRGGALPIGGVILLLLSAALLGGLSIRARPKLRQIIDRRLGMLYWLAAVGTCLAATLLGQVPHRGWYALGLWLASIGFVIGAALYRRPMPRPSLWLRTHRAEAGLVLACVSVALVVRTVWLETIPQTLIGDEASIGLEARDILSGRTDPSFVTGWAGLPRLTFLTMAAPMAVWGQGIFGLRMHAALAGAATIVTLYWLLRPEAGAWLAQCAIWLLATYPYHLHISRLGVNQADDSLLLCSTLAALFWGLRTRQPLGWALAGICAGLCLTVYPGARVAIVLLGVFGAIYAFRTRGRWLLEHRQGIAVATAAFVLTGLPMMRYYASHWGDFNDRLDQVGIIQTGWLQHQMQQTGRSAAALLWQQFLRTFFAYGFYGDTTQFFNDPEGLLQFWPAALFPLGLVATFLRARRRLFLLLILWLFGIVILGGALTLSPPYTTRLTGLAPVLVTMVALALITLARLGARLQLWKSRTGVLASAVLVAALGISGVHHYFVDYTPRYRFGDRNAELATAAGKYLATLGPAYRAYFLGLPRMFYEFSTIPFLAPNVTGADAPERLKGLPLGFMPNQPIFFFSIPERGAELRIIQQRLPGGRWLEFKRVVDGTPLFYAYQWGKPGASSPRFDVPARIWETGP
jgi:hypothetical protein